MEASMEPSWMLAFMVAMINFLCIGLMIETQYLNKSMLPHGSTIPGTEQKFLHWQDFYCQSVGDTLGLSLLQIAFAYFVADNNLHQGVWVGFAAVAAFDAVFFTRMCLGKNHKPDYGYPRTGEVSISGALHSVYHGVNMAIAVTMAGALVATVLQQEWLSPYLLPVLPFWGICVGLIGGAIWLVSMRIDFVVGNFDQLKLTEKTDR